MGTFAILHKDDARQALRLQRYFKAALASLFVLGFLSGLYFVGHMDRTGLQWSACSIFGCIIFFYVVFRADLNLKLRDPSLTSWQMVSASFVMASAAFFIRSEARDIVVPILLMIFYFGIYRMDQRAMLAFALLDIVFYGTMIAMLYLFRPHTLDLKLELLRWGVLSLVSLWFAHIGGHVTKLRRELALRKEAIEALLERDDLTGVGNRRFLSHMLEQEKSRADRSGSSYCVAILDLDYFKKVNDTYGHAVGDKILKIFAQVAQQDLRKIDYFGRHGGEEFMLIMSDTRLDGALATAERLRHNVENARYSDVDPPLIQTVSVGIAEYRRGEATEQVQLRADKAMYKAKSKGRNRVETDADPVTPLAAVSR